MNKYQEHTVLDAVFETIDVPVLLLDRDGCIVRFNSACESLSGYAEDEVVGREVWELLPEQHRAAMQARFSSPCADHYPCRHQDCWLTRDATLRTVDWCSTAVLDQSGEIEYILATGVDVSEQHRSSKRIEMYEHIISATNGHLSFVDSGYIYRAVNNAYLIAHDLEYDEIVGMHVATLLGEHIFEDIKPRLDRCLSGETVCFQGWFEFRGQGQRLMDVSYSPARDRDGCVNGVIVNSHDITDRNEMENERRLAAKVFQNAGDAIFITDSRGVIIEVNPAFCAISGYSRDELLGKNSLACSSGPRSSALYEYIWNTLLQRGRWEGEVWDRRKNGESYPKWLKLTSVTDAIGLVSHYVGIFSDISDQKAHVDKLHHMAHHDPLTTLPNRTLFHDRLSQAIIQAQRDNHRVAVMFIDLDHFKEINDAYGHDIGDQVLSSAARRISSCVRESDTIARMGGDEFTAILTDVSGPAAVAAVADKMISALQFPITIDQVDVSISCSIGVSIFPDCCATPDELIKCADDALYSAKRRGRNCHMLFVDGSVPRPQGNRFRE